MQVLNKEAANDSYIQERKQDVNDMTMSAIIKLIKSKTVGKRRYEYAADLTNQIIARKKKEGGGKLKHSVTWYANKVAGQVPGVDTKTLMRMIDDE
jgi:hypothetical protein